MRHTTWIPIALICTAVFLLGGYVAVGQLTTLVSPISPIPTSPIVTPTPFPSPIDTPTVTPTPTARPTRRPTPTPSVEIHWWDTCPGAPDCPPPTYIPAPAPTCLPTPVCGTPYPTHTPYPPQPTFESESARTGWRS